MRTRIIVCSLIALIAIFTASCLPFDREYIIDHAFRDLLPELNFTYDVGDNTTPLLWRAVFAGLGQFMQIYANDTVTTDFTCLDDAEFDNGLYSGGNIRLNANLNFVGSDNITGVGSINGVTNAYLQEIDDTDYFQTLTKRQPFIAVNQLYIRSLIGGSAGGWSLPGNTVLYTGAIANNVASADSNLYNILPLNNYYNIDWTEDYDFYIFFRIDTNSDANSIRNFQIKETTAYGNMTVRGVGIQIFNRDLYAESYGAGGRVSTSLGTTLTLWQNHVVWIKHRGAVPSIEWYLDDFTTPLYTETTANNIPQTNNQPVNFVVSVLNGASALDVQTVFPVMMGFGVY